MAFLIIASIALAIYAGWITWQYIKIKRKIAQLNDKLNKKNLELQKQSAIRQNLQRICNGRASELRRMREREAECVAEIRELESRASELNVSLFRESGLRILAQKEGGAERIRLDLLEKQLAGAQRKIKEQDEQAQNAERLYQSIIAQREAEIAQFQAAQARRARRRAKTDGELDQISLEELLGMPAQGGKHRGKED